jgi:hypothetical protein
VERFFEAQKEYQSLLGQFQSCGQRSMMWDGKIERIHRRNARTRLEQELGYLVGIVKDGHLVREHNGLR